MIDNKLPTLIQLQEGIEKLKKEISFDNNENLSLSEYYYKILNLIEKNIGIISQFIIPLDTREFDLTVFRAREIDESFNIELFNEYSYPPPGLTKRGRCNFPKHPVLYGSDNPLVALVELNKEKEIKNEIAISCWKPIKGDLCFNLEPYLNSELVNQTDYHIIKDHINQNIEILFNGYNNEEREVIKNANMLLHELFIYDKSYKISSSLSYYSLFQRENNPADVLMYPSVQSKYQGINYAVNPNFATNYLVLNRVYIINIESINRKTQEIKINFKRFGIVKGNKIDWKTNKDEGKTLNEFIKLDFPNMVKY
jgi:hypothetical protein